MLKALWFNLLLVCFTIAMSGSPFAEVKQFKRFSIDIPKECSVHEENGVATVRTGEDSFFSIGIFLRAEADNMTAKDFSEKFSQKLGGTAPVASGDGGWGFDVIKNDVPTSVEITADTQYIMTYMRDTSDKDWPDPLGKAYDSIKGSTPDIDAFMKKHLFAD